MPYTDTVMPNVFGHQTQREAAQEIQSYTPLVNYQCSPYLKSFLCSVYTPKCVRGKAQPPCRKLCEQARSGCESVLNEFGLPWPEALQCEKFTMESCEQVSLDIMFMLVVIQGLVRLVRLEQLLRNGECFTPKIGSFGSKPWVRASTVVQTGSSCNFQARLISLFHVILFFPGSIILFPPGKTSDQ